MANSLTNVMEIMVSLGVASLRQNAIAARLVNTDKNTEAAEKNQLIRVPVPSAVPAQAVTAGSANTATDLAPTGVDITLDQWYEARFKLSDRELQEVETTRILPMAVNEGIKSLANQIDSFILTRLKNRAYSVRDTTNPVAVADITSVRKLLNQTLAPVEDRRLVVDPTVEEEMLRLDAFRDLDKTGQTDPLLEGILGRRFGLDIAMDQNLAAHTAGTGSGYLTNSASLTVGTKTIPTDTGTGTILEGDIVTFAGHTQTYVVTSALSGGSFAIYPGLVVGVADNVAITVKATHTPNLAFQRNAFMFAMRPLAVPVGTPGVLISQASDPISGVNLRLEVQRLNKETIWSLDCLYGGAVVRPELLARLCD
jgi:hypothetical protein